MDAEYVKVAYIPCNSFKRIIEWISKDAVVARLEAARGIQSNTVNKSVGELAFIKMKDLRIVSMEIDYSYAGKHGIKKFPAGSVLKVLRNTDIEDIAIKHLDIILDGKEFYFKYLKGESVTKSEDSRIMLSFSASITKSEQIRNDISRFTAYEIDKLKFKYETLDLVGIFSMADKLKQEHANLLPSANQETKMLKEAMKLAFNEAPLRLRSYMSKGSKRWELSGMEEF